MRPWIIVDAAKRITERQAALSWLEEHGVKLTGDRGQAMVTVHLNLASACPGVKEAAEVLNAYARLNLPTAVKHAIECCRNDIAMHTAAIRQELDQ